MFLLLKRVIISENIKNRIIIYISANNKKCKHKLRLL